MTSKEIVDFPASFVTAVKEADPFPKEKPVRPVLERFSLRRFTGQLGVPTIQFSFLNI